MPTPAAPKLTPGNLQAVGIAVETVSGTPAAAPTLWIPVDSPKYAHKQTSLADKALRGSMAAQFGNQLGTGYDTLSYSTNLYADSVFVHLLAALGTPDAITGSADPYTHKTSLLNSGNGQPATHTLFYLDGSGKCMQIAGCQSSNLKLSVKADGLVGVDAEWTGMPAVTIPAPAVTAAMLPAAPAWNSKITLGGVELGRYSEVGLTYKRSTSAVFTVHSNSKAPAAIYCGELDAQIDLVGIYEGAATDVDWLNFLADTQPALLVELGAANDPTHRLTLQHSKVAYTDASFSGTNSLTQITSKATAIANATDALSGGYSPALASLTSAVSTAFV